MQGSRWLGSTPFNGHENDPDDLTFPPYSYIHLCHWPLRFSSLFL